MKQFLKKHFSKKSRTRKILAMVLGLVSLLFFIVSVQLNFEERDQLYASVVRVNAAGFQETMAFKDYRDDLVRQASGLLHECVNSTRPMSECALLSRQVTCLQDSVSQEEFAFCP